MKELKFRVWHKKSKKMIDYETDSLGIQIDLSGDLVSGPEHDEPFEDGVLMQFTGLYDCKKAPIYEGDIISFLIGSEHTNYKYLESHSVIEHDIAEGDEAQDLISGWGIPYTKDVEVIGNKYEHPHLIESPYSKYLEAYKKDRSIRYNL